MNRSPAQEETLVFIGYMHVSKADGSQLVNLQRDAVRVCRYKMTAPGCGGRKRRAKNSSTSSFLTRDRKFPLNDNER